MEQFKVGDIVQLKSGGPKMTVKDPGNTIISNNVYCQWFAGSKLEHGHFAPETLNRIKDEPKQS